MQQSKYRPIRRIGVGGMAEVVLAMQQGLGGFEKLVVLKRILPHLRDDPEFVQMFLDEARLAVSLSHPNLVQIFDIQRDEETFSVAMEYISGEDLSYVIGKARKGELALPVPIACRIIADVAEGLEYAHHATDANGRPLGMVHRDIAPANIIVSYAGVSKIVDFGIAKANVSHVYTKPGRLKGKYAYMSPEQVQQQSLDQRSDVFSLGVVAWELLTGRRLFEGPGPAAMLKGVMEIEPDPPSQHNPLVSPQLDQTILHALQKDPRKRLGSARELRDQIGAALQREQVVHHRDVGQWMQTGLARRYEQRLALERAVTLQGRQAPSEPVEEGMLPALFGPPGSGTSYPSVGMATASSGPTGGSTMASYSAVNPGPPSANAARSGRSGLLYGLVGAVVALMLMLVLVVGFWIGRGGEPPASIKPTPNSVGIFLHVKPAGARLYLNGRKQRQLVSESGQIVAVDPEREVHIRLEREGYEASETVVKAPAAGVSHVYLNLTSSGDRAVATAVARPVIQAEPPAPPEPPESPRAAEPPESPRKPAATTTRRRDDRPRTRRTSAVDRSSRSASRDEKRRSSASRRSSSASPVLLVSYTPANATLIVDGVARPGRSPARIEGLGEGPHMVSVRARDYDSVDRRVVLAGSRQRVLDIELRQTVGTVDVVTVPSGAAVMVDGQPKGRAPLMGLRLSVDKVHRLVAELPGYKPWSSRVTPSAGKNPTVVAALVPALTTATTAGARPTARRPSDITVARARLGQASRGKQLLSGRCGSCHGKSAGRVGPRRYTQAQWRRYFSTTRHAVHAPFREKFSTTDLADVKAYMISRAADVHGATAAGVR